MPTLQELSDKVTELQTALDEEQQQVADLISARDSAIATLEASVADLQAQVTAGGTDAERQAVVNKINSAITDLKSTVEPTS